MIGALLATCVLASPGLRYTVQIIGPSSRPYGTMVHALNDEGAVIGTTYDGQPTSNKNFVWKNGRFRYLTLEPGRSMFPQDINNRGDIVGTRSVNGRSHGVVLLAEGGFIPLNPPNGGDMSAAVINENRWVTGWIDTSQGIGPFVWKGGGEVIPLGFTSGPPTNQSEGLEINESNVIVGYERGPDYPFYGWVWTERDGLRRVFSVHFSYMNHVNDLGQWLTASWRPRTTRGSGWGVYDRIDGEPVRRYQDFALSKINNRGEILAGRNGGETFWVITPSETFLLGERVLPLGTWSAAGIDINQRGQILAQAQYRPTRRSYVVLLTPVEGTPSP